MDRERLRQLFDLEGRVVLEEILARFPGYHLDESRLVFRRADQIQGLVSAPIRVA